MLEIRSGALYVADMIAPLTLSLSEHDTVEYVLQRAAAELRTPDSIVEEMVLREKAYAEAEARAVTLAVAPELGGIAAELVRDDEETDEEFAQRRRSFAALLARS